MTRNEFDAINHIFRLILEIQINISDENIKNYKLSQYDIDNLQRISESTEFLILVNEPISDNEIPL
jgi:hypothetical protein